MFECCASVSKQLTVPRNRLKSFGDCTFSIAALRLWNALPGFNTDCKSVHAFNKSLKIHLLKTAFDKV